MARIPLVEPKCGMCRHFRLDMREAIDGECRRHAPQIWVGSGLLRGTWPIVLADDLCGEYAVDHARVLALLQPSAGVPRRASVDHTDWRA